MIEIIPAIDVINGKCVRLSQGDYTQKKEYGDPLEMALQFEDHGIKRLHLVDLDGAREKRVVNHHLLEKISSRTSLVIDAGGGLRSDDDLHIVFESGAHMVTGGSVAVEDRELFMGWLLKYGPERIILGADFRDGIIAISGWAQETELGLIEFLSGYVDQGIRKAICTDIALDGMLEGPSFQQYAEIKGELELLELIASGGIGDMEQIEKLDKAGINGVIVGKAIYENRISLKTLEKYILKNS